MYICKDCGAKYAQKVEYCDCGNNTFDFVEEKILTEKKPVKSPKQPLTYEQKSELVSRLFLAFCIILSAIVWAVPVKTDTPVEEKQLAADNLNNSGKIPSIDKFWDDTPVYIEKKQIEPEAKVINEVPIPLNVIPDYAKPKPIEQKKVVQQNIKSKTNTQPKQKQTAATNKQISEVKTSIPKQTAQTAQKIQNVKPKTESKQESKKQVNAPSPKLYENETRKVVSQPKKTEPQKPAYNPNSKEMLQYKGNLRAALFSKFAVGSIQGNGSCSVKFSVDSTGKLVNRAFVKQSDNKSLNDAVYYMLMSVPKFSPPPSGYNGETIMMNFKIENGGYEISIH